MESMVLGKDSNGSMPRTRENSLHLRPVAPEESGEGLPYAPVDWPNPGDIWTWRVGRRVAITGHYLDRYLYLPNRLCYLENSTRKKHGFASKLSVERYIRSAFPGADISAFFASFSWKIPSKPSSTNGIEGLTYFPVLSEETEEHSLSGSQSDGVGCKAGNKMCSSLVVHEENPALAPMPCDICCSEPGFCRDCCCILCCKTINSNYGGYSYIKCEAMINVGYICGHVAHIDCALRAYMAGTLGGSIGLDTEYYCRRCDARTDLVPHARKLLQICKSVDSRDEIEKIFSVGVCILRGSQKTDAKGLLNHIELLITKLKCGAIPDDIWKMGEDDSAVSTGVSPNGNATLDVAHYEEIIKDKTSLLDVVTISSDYRTETLKLEDDIDQVLQALRFSQETEYKIAEERLYDQKQYLQNLYQQLDQERLELARRTSNTNTDALLSAVLDRVEQIKREVMKLKDMKEVAKGFGRTSKDILKEHFGLEIEN